MPAPLLLADTPWLLYRSFFALPKTIVDGDGRPVNALLGTVNAILALIEPPSRAARAALRDAGIAEPPRAVVACTGAEEAAYRVELYRPYHAHRDPMPPELAEQWRRAPALLEALGWTVTGSEDLEADDLMFSYARQETAAGGGRALLLSGDRDMYGAVGERVAVVETGKGGAVGLIGPEQVLERYGIAPELVPDFIALRGDPSDGLPGAPGIGAKTAAELLRRYGPLEDVLRAAGEAANRVRREQGEMSPRAAQSLRENDELLRSFKRIATLQEIEVLQPADRPTDFAAGAKAAEENGMRRLAERLEKLAQSRSAGAP
ncbi:MAG TPA: 5'-3' exonuclease H3TH domain-containing protein [Solirubrobacteraceae bacterium]|nr:5'-3' exonuclease H3TH domain-containing protein [Solirubrobacteraceae bacterium]